MLNFFKLKKFTKVILINTYMGFFRETIVYLKTLTFPYFFNNLQNLRTLSLMRRKW